MKTNFTNFTVPDFAQEPSFINWVRSRDEGATRFWEQWMAENPDRLEEIDQARRLVLALTVKEEGIPEERIQSIWGRIDLATQDAPGAGPSSRSIFLRRWISYAAAACIIGLIALAYLYNPSKVILAEPGQRLTVSLPDGSSVAVNAGSKVSYKTRGWQGARKVALEGEAFFKVVKGERFVVETPQGSVEVLGTSFNVKVWEEAFEVSCFTGKIRVSSGSEVRILTAGQSTQLEQDGALQPPAAFEPTRAASWRDGKFYFQKASLKEVFAELSRQYAVSIKASPEVLERTTTTYFELGNLDTALYKVCWPMQLDSRRQGQTIYITE